MFFLLKKLTIHVSSILSHLILEILLLLNRYHLCFLKLSSCVFLPEHSPPSSVLSGLLLLLHLLLHLLLLDLLWCSAFSCCFHHSLGHPRSHGGASDVWGTWRTHGSPLMGHSSSWWHPRALEEKQNRKKSQFGSCFCSCQDICTSCDTGPNRFPVLTILISTKQHTKPVSSVTGVSWMSRRGIQG